MNLWIPLLNGFAVSLFGSVLSASFCNVLVTRRSRLIIWSCMTLLLLMQSWMYIWWDAAFWRRIYPLIVHLPLVLILYILTRRLLWSVISVLTAYLCCQLRRWIALLAVTMLSGGDMMQDVAELIVTIPLLLRLDASNHAFVLEPSNIRCFHIFEDESPLFEGTKDELICYQSAIPDRIRSLNPDIERIQKEQRQYKQLERLEDILEQQAKLRGESYSRSCIPYPDINRLKPFEKFYLLIEVDHPYCKDQAEFILDGPSFYGSTIKDYLHEYALKVVKMRELATQLMNTLNPDAPERRVSNRTKPSIRTLPIVAAAPANPVTEIKKYKSLMGNSAITKEEYAAKKQQILNI